VPQLQPIDIAELIGAVVARLARVLRDVVVELDLAADLPSVAGDYALVDQVVSNLLENAARHAPAHTTVRVRARAGDGVVVIEVADEGGGVPKEVREVIFEPFRSGGRAGSTGVGLAICKAVVDAHGGTIAVGDGPTGGATFTITLPVA
jgi:two-component system sensor histidine kinase KdpD